MSKYQWDSTALATYLSFATSAFSLALSGYLLLSKRFQSHKKTQEPPKPLDIDEEQLQLYNQMLQRDKVRVDLVNNLCSMRYSKMRKEKQILERLKKLHLPNDQGLMKIGVQICKRIVDDYRYSTKTNQQLSYILSQYLNWNGQVDAFIQLMQVYEDAPNNQASNEVISGQIHLKWLHEGIQRQKIYVVKPKMLKQEEHRQ